MKSATERTLKIVYAVASLAAGVLLLGCGAGKPKLVVIENDSLRVAISTLGAELQSIRHKNSGTEYLWQGDPEYWEARAPVMFPVNVRFKDNRFSHEGREYEIPKMGLAVISEFVPKVAVDGRSAEFELRANEETRERYPFDFVFKVIYRLEGSRLINEFIVENAGDAALYFAAGGHPGFRCPFEGGRDRGDYAISFSEPLTVERNEIVDSLIQPTRVPFLKNEDSIALDDERIPNGGMFQKDMKARVISVGRKGMEPYVSVDLGDFPNVNLWSPPGMPFVCIEPMVAHHDFQESPMSIAEKPYLVAVEAGESKRYRFTVSINHNGTL